VRGAGPGPEAVRGERSGAEAGVRRQEESTGIRAPEDVGAEPGSG